MNDTTVTKMHLVCPHCNATNRVPSDKLQAELNCGKCHQPLLAAHPDNLNEAAFNAQLMPATPAPIIMIASAIKSPQSRAGVLE